MQHNLRFMLLLLLCCCVMLLVGSRLVRARSFLSFRPLSPPPPPGDIELKKLVYLYLINYAKSNPDLAILAVNTFVMVRMPAI